MNILLWILQIVIGLYFIAIGVMHFIVPPGLPPVMSWMYDLAPALHWISGTAELLCGLGLILPGLFKKQTYLTWMAAYGIAVVMVGAMIYHLSRGETTNIVGNVVIFLIAIFIGFGRQRLQPIAERGQIA